MTFSTYLPVFPGFYGTIFDCSETWESCEFDSEPDFRERYPELDDIPMETIENKSWEAVDWRAAHVAVTRHCVETLPKFLPELVVAAEFEEMRSPREYNFDNDAGDCKITVDLPRLRRLLSRHKTELAAFLKRRYTSCDGFISFHPNDIAGWKEKTCNFTELDGHYLGALLDFAAELEHGDGAEKEMFEIANVNEVYCNNIGFDVAKLRKLVEEDAKRISKL